MERRARNGAARARFRRRLPWLLASGVLVACADRASAPARSATSPVTSIEPLDAHTSSAPRGPLPDCPIENEAIQKRFDHLRLSAQCVPVIAAAKDISFFKSASLTQGNAKRFDLAPLAKATGLESVSLRFRSATPDLSPLSKLPRLKTLRVINGVESLDWLRPMTQLENVDVEPSTMGTITNLSALGTLPKLTGFSTNQAFDLAELARLVPNIRSLRATGVQHPTTIVAFAELETLELGCLQRGQPLQPPPKLRSLRLGCYQDAPALDAIASFTKLRELDISAEGPVNLTSIIALTRLERLDLHDRQVSDLKPLSKLRELRWLDIHNTEVTSLAPLAGLPKLEFLDAGGAPVKSVAPLAQSRSLRELHLPFTQVQSVLPLTQVASLKELMVPRGCDRPDVLALRRVRPDIRLMMWLDKAEPEDPTCF